MIYVNVSVSLVFYILAALIKIPYSYSNYSHTDLKISWSSKVWELSEKFKQALNSY